MRLFRRDMQRGMTGWMFWTAVALGLAMCLRAMVSYYANDALGVPEGTLNLFCITAIWRNGGYLRMVSAIIAVLPFSMAYMDDMRSGYLKFQLMRMCPANYALQRILSTAVLGGLAFVVFLGIYLAICCVVDPHISLRGYVDERFVFADVYAHSIKGAIALYALQCFEFGACYALLAMGISALVPIKIVVVLVPLLFHEYFHMLGWMLPIAEATYFMRVVPTLSFDVMQDNLMGITMINGLVGMLGILLFVIGFVRWRRGNWMV